MIRRCKPGLCKEFIDLYKNLPTAYSQMSAVLECLPEYQVLRRLPLVRIRKFLGVLSASTKHF